MASENILEVRNLSVDYASETGTVHAVDDISFTVKRGEIFGLAGESGSGKSTVAFALARLLKFPAKITNGEIVFNLQLERETPQEETMFGDSVDILDLTAEELQQFRWRKLSIVFQSAMNALNPVLNIYTQIADVIKAHDPSMSSSQVHERAKELIRLVGISPDRLSSYPHQLSGGMRQRAIIAIALALNPELIIMDEPTTALDVVVQREILNEIKQLQAKFGFSVIFITHDLSLLLEMADEIAVMYAGRIVEQATREALYARASHPYTLGLMHSFPALRGPRRSLTGIPGAPPDLRHVPSGCAFNPRCAYAFAPCTTVLPLLRVPEGEGKRHTVACHLYDATLNPNGLPEQIQQLRDESALQSKSQGQQFEPPVSATMEARHD